ncbi:hypothetical protein [Streptomyces sp. SGAir0957]
MSAPQPGCWAECVVRTPETQTLVASYDAQSAQAALRWVRVLVRMLQPVLSEDEAEPLTVWLLSGHLRSREELESGHPFSMVLKPGQRPGLQLGFSIRPVLFLPLADRDPHSLPPCSQQWAQPMALATALTPYRSSPCTDEGQ